MPEFRRFIYRWHHAVIVPNGHPLLAESTLTIERIAAYPIITYSEGFTGRARVDEAFAKAGITPNIAMSALDADVIKAYVELGLGVGIVAAMAVDPERDRALRMLPCETSSNPTPRGLRRGGETTSAVSFAGLSSYARPRSARPTSARPRRSITMKGRSREPYAGTTGTLCFRNARISCSLPLRWALTSSGGV